MMTNPLRNIGSKWNESLAWRIAASLIGFSFVLAILYGIGAYATIYYFMKKNEAISRQKRIELTAQKIQTALVTLNSSIENLAKNTIVINAMVDAHGRDSYLLPFLRSSHLPQDIPHRLSLCDFKGEIIASNQTSKGSYKEITGLVKVLVDSAKPVSKILNSNTILICHPVIYPATGTAEGFLALEIPVNDLLSKLDVSPGAADKGMKLLANNKVIWIRGITANATHSTSELTFASPLAELDMSLMFWTAESRILTWFTIIFICTTLIAFYLSAQIAYKFSNKLTSGLSELDNAAAAITASGMPQGEVKVLGRDEVGRLAESFNSMITRLKGSYDNLELLVTERTNQLSVANKHLEELIAARTSELERINSELSLFCYSISHELRAPVARLQGFSAMLRDGDANEADYHQIFERIDVASLQMQKVIDAILLLSRLSQIVMESRQIDFSSLAREVATELQLQKVGENTSIAVQDEIFCTGDPNLIKICLVNLIGNAFKYSSRQNSPHVEIGMKEDGNHRHYFVKDNGAGFDMEFVNKLFVPFHRLHHEKDFPGTGIGLATVQRIVERHGGTVWAEAVVGEGATFYFTLGD